MKISVKKWGNSLGIRLPKLLTKELGIEEGSNLNINLINDKIQIIKAINIETLDDLLEQITYDNVHSEIDTYQAIGKELC